MNNRITTTTNSYKQPYRPANKKLHLGCPMVHTETKTAVCQVCVHCSVFSSVSGGVLLWFVCFLFFWPLTVSKIPNLEEILVDFCGRFAGGELKGDGIFVSADKCREVWAELARLPSDRCHELGLHLTSPRFIEKRIFEVTVHRQAQSAYRSYRFVCMWIVHCTLAQFTQHCLTSPLSPHHTEPACMLVEATKWLCSSRSLPPYMVGQYGV